ncbi:MAG: hypothetical protein K0U15_01590, partial [Proteobacteria bacterium]|nr:hypothetical protein [Pseudomonadota bacterium]
SPNYSQSEMHMTVEEAETTQHVKPEKIPALVKASPTAAALSNSEDASTFDVVVTSVPVRDLLFALARDAGINMDIDDRVSGFVSISALDQTLDAILERISKQVEIRIEQVGDAIVVLPDLPYHKYYQVDFLNISRTYSSSAATGGVGNTGSSSVSNTGASDFWTSLEGSLDQILEVSYEGGEESASIIDRELKGEDEQGAAIVESEFKREVGGNSYNLSPDTGVLIVYAPDSLQKEVQTLLDRSLSIAKRQVLLEATIVEVVLNNQYSQGIDWSLFNSLATDGLALYQGAGIGGAAAALEYITNVIEYTIPEQTFDAAGFSGFTGGSNDIDSDLIERAFGITLTPGEIVSLNARTDVDGGIKSRANYLASIVSSRAAGDARSSAYSDSLNRVTEYNPQLGFEIDNATGYATYTFGGDYSREEVNEAATAQSSGGLKPNTLLPGSTFTGAFRQGDISAAVQLLDTFGDAKVLSSPRISALNHQPALLRVVDQEVYFNFEVSEEISEDTGVASSRTFSATENTVDVGFSMNVFPHIGENDEIILNLKPAVTRVLDYRQAPILESFGSAASGTQNLIPITRVRELESLISLRDGEIAVLGGLLEDRTGDDSSSVPGLSRIPGIGTLFENKNESTYKTEFVVFIRAKIITDPSINGDYSDYRYLLPNSDFILRDTEETLFPPSQLKTR